LRLPGGDQVVHLIAQGLSGRLLSHGAQHISRCRGLADDAPVR
jgi:hypothetical protein